ncbi:MAG: hypothetical protein A2X33_08405 [Elusimicrobia bacterium GWA2_51_34]|nr:MAG: hypothetical protein A2X33_08405 [Elusimicrobia bacterium GWA2_51_34]
MSLLACSAAVASFLYQNEPSTSLDASAGFNAGGMDYFLLKLRIYHPAKGIAAFPDGGQPKVSFESVYLFKLDKSGPQKIAELGIAADLSSTYFKSSQIRSASNGVLIKIPWMDRKFYSKKLNPDKNVSARKDEYYLYDPATAKIAVVKDPGGEWPKETLSLIKTGKLFRDFSDFDAAGLPNPLDYIPGAGEPDGLADIISKGLGERRLRLAAARRLMASGNEGLLRPAIAGLDKIAAARKISFWTEEKALLEQILAVPGKKKGE